MELRSYVGGQCRKGDNGDIHDGHSNAVDLDLQLGSADAGVPGVLTDSMGLDECSSDSEIARRGEECERPPSANESRITHACGGMRKERSKRLWILGDVMMPECEKMGWP